MAPKNLPPIPPHLRPRFHKNATGDMIITIPAWDSTGHRFSPSPSMHDRIMSLVRGITGPAIRVLQRIETYADGTTVAVVRGHEPVVVPQEQQDRERDIDQAARGADDLVAAGLLEPEWDEVDPSSDEWKRTFDVVELECLMRTYHAWADKHPEDLDKAEARCVAIGEYLSQVRPDGKSSDEPTEAYGYIDKPRVWMSALDNEDDTASKNNQAPSYFFYE